MSNKRNRRGHRLIRRLAESHTASGLTHSSFVLYGHRFQMNDCHFYAMREGLEKGYSCRRAAANSEAAVGKRVQAIVKRKGGVCFPRAIVDIEAIGRDGRPATTVMYSTPNGPVSQVFQDRYVREPSQSAMWAPCI
jgi:hypothetical protein